MDIKKLIKDLCSVNAVSGMEHDAAKEIGKLLAPYYDEVVENVNGSCIFKKNGTKSDSGIILDAHLDQIGMMVSGIRDDGLVSFVSLGGLDRRTLHASRVTIHADCDVEGIITSEEPYVGHGTKGIEISKLYIYTDLTKDELIDKGVKVGVPASLYAEQIEFENGNVANRSLDDRISIAVIAATMEKLTDKKLACDVYIVCSSQEESYGRGATTAANIINADSTVVIDVDYGNTPDVDKKICGILGKGPTIALSVETDRRLTKKLISLTDEKELPAKVVLNPTSTGTNANHYVNSETGIPTVAVGIPQRNMHTPLEVINTKDVEYAATLISKYILDQYEIK